MSTSLSKTDTTRSCVAILGLAAILRGLHGIVRWHEDAWRYAAYPSAVVDHLEAGAVWALPSQFTGLHPPAWPLLHALAEVLGAPPLVWLLMSIGFSLGAVGVVARRSPVSGMILATAPVAVHYSAEVNQYPLLIFALAMVWAGPHPRWVRAASVLAAWTHALGGISALTRAVVQRDKRALGWLVVAVLPLLPTIGRLLHTDATFRQPDLRPDLMFADLVGRFGVLGVFVFGLATFGMRRMPSLAAGVALPLAAIAVLVGLHIAAPHQFPYLLVPLVPVALATATLTGKWRTLALVLAVAQGAWQLTYDAQRVRTILEDNRQHARAIDVAIPRLTTPWSCTDIPSPDCAGDALVLLRLPGQNDDDKTRFSPELWRIRPWWRASRVLPPTPSGDAFDWSDHRNGQPRLVSFPHGQFVVYVHDQVRPSLRTLGALHPNVWLVVSVPTPSLEAEVAALLNGPATPIGPDLLGHLTPAAPTVVQPETERYTTPN